MLLVGLIEGQRDARLESFTTYLAHFLLREHLHPVWGSKVLWILIFTGLAGAEQSSDERDHMNAANRRVQKFSAIFIAKGSVESTHKVPTSHYRTKHCHAAVAPLGGLTHR